MTDALVAFLKARLDDDERVAGGTGMPHDWHQGPGTEDPEWADDEMVLMWPPEFHTPYEQDKHWRGLTADPAGLAAHIARQDPARTLREVEAKRALVAMYADAVRAHEESARLLARLRSSGRDVLMAELEEAAAIHKRDALQGVLRILALPYSDHPEYEEAYQP